MIIQEICYVQGNLHVRTFFNRIVFIPTKKSESINKPIETTQIIACTASTCSINMILFRTKDHDLGTIGVGDQLTSK